MKSLRIGWFSRDKPEVRYRHYQDKTDERWFGVVNLSVISSNSFMRNAWNCGRVNSHLETCGGTEQVAEAEIATLWPVHFFTSPRS
jgi:hypothetical protein